MNGASRTITVEVSQGVAGLLHATSPEMKELFVSGETQAELREAVPHIVPAIIEARGERPSDTALEYRFKP